jgi:hypothetical protein
MTAATIQRQTKTDDRRLLSSAEAIEWLAVNRSKINSVRAQEWSVVERACGDINRRKGYSGTSSFTDEEASSVEQVRIQFLKEKLPVIPDASMRLALVAKTVLANPACLAMERWHSECGTAHCIAGWAEHMLGDQAVVASSMFAPYVLGMVLLGVEASGYFYKDNNEALEFLARFED